MLIPKFSGMVDRGVLQYNNPGKLNDYLKILEGQVEITISKPKKKRSNAQNAYFHSVIVKILADELGYSESEMKEIIRGKFFYHYTSIRGKEYKVLESTTFPTTSIFEEKMSQIREWASIEFRIFVPAPNEIEITE